MVIRELQQSLLLTALLIPLDLVLGVIYSMILGTTMISYIAASGAFLEFGLMLVVGGCLMARQPIDTEGRYNSDGAPTRGWRMALIGRRLLMTALLLFMSAYLISIIGQAIGF